jgi:hypothetical protein
MVDVYDNLFDHHYVKVWYKFVSESYFKAEGLDDYKWSPFQTQLYSLYSQEDWERIGLCKTPAYQDIIKKYSLNTMEITQIRVNLLTCAERTNLHTDEVGVTVLYYANPQWEISWGGHTLFMDKKCENVEKTVLFKPGRLVVFDGTYPHMILPPTIAAPGARYTLAIQYKKSNMFS